MKDNKNESITFGDVLMPYLTDDENILNVKSDVAKDILLFNDTGLKLEAEYKKVGTVEEISFRSAEEPEEEFIEEEPEQVIEEAIESENIEPVAEKEPEEIVEEDELTEIPVEPEKDVAETPKTFGELKATMEKQVQENSYEVNNLGRDMSSMITMFLVAVVVLLGYTKGLSNFLGFNKIFIFVIWFVVLTYVSIISHELGHLIFGIFSGYEFASFRIGKHMFVKNSGRLTYKKYKIQGTSGQCLMIPPDLKGEEVIFPYKVYNLGGVIMNVILAIASVVGFIIVPYTMGVSEGLLTGFIINCYFAAMNGIPRTIEGIANDGANAMYLEKDQDIKRAFYSQLKINGLITKGVRLKDMDENLFKVPESADLKKPLVCAMKAFEGEYYIDRHEFDKAREVIQDALDEIGNTISVHKMELQCDLLFLELIGQCRKEEIEKIYDNNLQRYVANTKRYYVARRRLLYAYELLYKVDEEAARSELESFEIIGRSYPYEIEVDSEIELLHVVHDIFETEYEEYDEDEKMEKAEETNMTEENFVEEEREE